MTTAVAEAVTCCSRVQLAEGVIEVTFVEDAVVDEEMVAALVSSLSEERTVRVCLVFDLRPKFRFTPEARRVIAHDAAIQAAAGHLPPALWKQLKPGGRIVIPIGGVHEVQRLVVISKQADGTRRSRTITHVRFVPLTRGTEAPS